MKRVPFPSSCKSLGCEILHQILFTPRLMWLETSR